MEKPRKSKEKKLLPLLMSGVTFQFEEELSAVVALFKALNQACPTYYMRVFFCTVGHFDLHTQTFTKTNQVQVLTPIKHHITFGL